MNAEHIRSHFRRIDRSRYPEVESYSWDEIYGYGDAMAPGGLYLAAKMAASLDIKADDAVLDLACGKGETSIYMAQEFGAQVLAVDLRISATTLGDKFRALEAMMHNIGMFDRKGPLNCKTSEGLDRLTQTI